MKKSLRDNNFILAEAAIVERLRRGNRVTLHNSLVHAPLIYDEVGRDEFKKIYTDYITIAKKSETPILIGTPTWRANKERVDKSNIILSINSDAVLFMKEIRASFSEAGSLIKIGGLIGCKNDCYIPEEGLSINEAEEFHSWKIEQLTKGFCRT